MTDISEFQQGVRPCKTIFLFVEMKFVMLKVSQFIDAAPDITQFNNTRRGADRVTRYVNVSQTEAGDTSMLSIYQEH